MTNMMQLGMVIVVSVVGDCPYCTVAYIILYDKNTNSKRRMIMICDKRDDNKGHSPSY